MFTIGRQKLPRHFRVSIDDHAAPVKLLLFVRHAWSLEEGTEPLPLLAPAPGTGSSALPAAAGREVWLQRWNHEWRRMRDWYALRDDQPRDLSQADMQRLSRPGQELTSQLPPFWTIEHGADGLDMDAFRAWDRLTLELRPRRESHRNIKAMADAWERGLIKIIVLPYRGHYAALLAPGKLVISATTRRDENLFRSALELLQ